MALKSKKEIQRNFVIGDEWVYFKLYMGQRSAESFLIQTVLPLSKYLLEKKIIDKWFYIRYGDPEFHIRLRFRCPDRNNIGIIINKLREKLDFYINNDIIWKISLETYERELERYGALSITQAETIFFQDSLLVLDFIKLDLDERFRWLFSLKGLDFILDSFKYSLKNKLELLENLRLSFGLEFELSKMNRKQLDKRYRKEKDQINEFMELSLEDDQLNKLIATLFNKSTLVIEQPINKILNLYQEGVLDLHINNLVSSYLHMFMNRLFRSKNRTYEMICYDFLWRYYKEISFKNTSRS